jgi:hypothetical protein
MLDSCANLGSTAVILPVHPVVNDQIATISEMISSRSGSGD